MDRTSLRVVLSADLSYLEVVLSRASEVEETNLHAEFILPL